MDLAWRAQLAGYRCIYTPRAIVYHHLAATGGGVTASFYDGRNMIWILIKDYPAALWRKHAVKILRAQFPGLGSAARLARSSSTCPPARHGRRAARCAQNAAQTPRHSAGSPCINSVSGIDSDAGAVRATRKIESESLSIDNPSTPFPLHRDPGLQRRSAAARQSSRRSTTFVAAQPYPVEIVIVEQ